MKRRWYKKEVEKDEKEWNWVFGFVAVLVSAALLVVLVLLMVVGCGPVDKPPAPESDSGQDYQMGSEIPVDDNIYTIRGVVVGDVSSLTRQTERAHGSYSSYEGTGSGSYFGPEFEGKGFIRLQVLESDTHRAGDGNDIAPEGSVVILKMTDTKGIMLQPGDEITLRCRRQYEAIAAVRENQTFIASEVETWELDYCRLVKPIIREAVSEE